MSRTKMGIGESRYDRCVGLGMVWGVVELGWAMGYKKGKRVGVHKGFRV